MQPTTFARSYLVCLALLALCRTATAEEPRKVLPQDAGLAADKLHRIDALLQDAVDKKQIAGAVALVSRHGKVRYLQGIGMRDAEAKSSMTADTIFRIA